MAGVDSPYQNLVKVTTADATAINALLATMNGDDYLASNVVFNGAGGATLLFTKNLGATYTSTAPQKVNEVAVDQTAVDDDVLAEAEDGNVPTGVFADGGTMFILYQQLNAVIAP